MWVYIGSSVRNPAVRSHMRRVDKMVVSATGFGIG